MVKKRRTEDEKVEQSSDKLIIDEILFNNRIVFIYGEIDNDMAKEVNKRLTAMYLKDPIKPILIDINSGGGSCTDGLAIIDLITSMPNPVITNISGQACSMASYISIVGDKRLMSKNAYWMSHPMSSWESDYLPFMKDGMDFIERLDIRLDGIYKKYTKLNKKDFQKFKHGELWLNAEECLQKKIIDKIG